VFDVERPRRPKGYVTLVYLKGTERIEVDFDGQLALN